MNSKGTVIDRERYASMLKEYYQTRGWDPETGMPDASTLEDKGLGELASSFHRQVGGGNKKEGE
jgi:aldehyde:ferredoxin oxidoreductase